jgi:hypothetical protein
MRDREWRSNIYRISLRTGSMWLTPNLALIIQCLLHFFFKFYIPRKMLSLTP